MEALVRRIGDVTVKSIGELSREGVLYVADGNHGQDRPRREEFVEDGIPFIRGRDIDKNGNIDFENCDKINEVAYHRIMKGFGKADDILFSHAGTVGKLIRVPNDAPDFIANPAVTVYRSLKPEIINQDFLFAYMHSWEFLSQVWSMTGETDIFDYISLQKQRKLLIPIPLIEQQIQMSELSTNFSKLIRLNKKMMNNLDHLCSTLFRAWFIDFDPVKAKIKGKFPSGMNEETAALFPDSFEDSELGPMPTGWKVKSLLEVSNLYDNLRVPLSSMERNERKGNYPYHGATSVMDYVDDFIFDGVHLLIAEDGSVVNEEGYPVLQYVWGKFWVNNHAHVLQGKDDFTTEHLHQYVKHFYIQPFVTGAVQLKINQKALHNVKLVTAPPNINNAFNKIIQSLYRSIRENKMKNEILTLTRDALLPRLIYGELEVN